MKKIISLICTLLLISSLSVSAFTEAKNCTIMGEMEAISYDGYMYYPIDNSDLYIEDSDYDYPEYEFDDKEFEKQINNIEILVPYKFAYIIEAYVDYASVSETIYYIRSDKKEWMDEFLKGKNASHIITQNSRAYVDRFLDFESVENWISEVNKVSVTAKQFRAYTCHPVYITDSSKTVRLQVGDVYENGDEFYFIRYSDYTKADLYGDGTYANLSVAYMLTDIEYIKELKETYSEEAQENVDEEVAEEFQTVDSILSGFTKLSLVVVIALFLVLIPLAAIVLSIIFLYVKHAAPIYRGWLKAIIVTAAVVLACSIPIIILLF